MGQHMGALGLLLLMLVDKTSVTNVLRATSRQQGQVTVQLVKVLCGHVC